MNDYMLSTRCNAHRPAIPALYRGRWITWALALLALWGFVIWMGV